MIEPHVERVSDVGAVPANNTFAPTVLDLARVEWPCVVGALTTGDDTKV